jgi:hypothetical protein
MFLNGYLYNLPCSNLKKKSLFHESNPLLTCLFKLYGIYYLFDSQSYECEIMTKPVFIYYLNLRTD